jgi:putative radical SAM enzyme (TIGR03279 family)
LQLKTMGYPRKNTPGIRVRFLPRSSVLYRAGLRANDVVVSVNGARVVDELDFMFYSAAATLELDILRNGRPARVAAVRKPGSFSAIDFYQKPVRRCANRCVFCFIDQMPPGLRAPLYIKDEDLSHSFLNGNYMTLSNAAPATLRKAVSLGLSPLYISVHATDPAVRLRMLGVAKAPPIMDQLRFLRDNGISFHTQVVVCPGYNDGAVLTKTIRELFSIGKGLLSIAVVPVGLTRYRRFPLAPVSREKAREICAQAGALSDRDAKANGKRRLFLADEFFQRAGLPIPGAAYYEDYPQIENGVGLIRRLFEEWNDAKKKVLRRAPARKKRTVRGKRYLVVTAASALPSLERIARECEGLRRGFFFHVLAAENRFFGDSVTVAGLLTARDVVRTIRRWAAANRCDGALLPKAMFNYAGYTLDGWSAGRLAKKAGIRVTPLSSIKDLLIV